MSDDDTYEIPLQDQRIFGAGIKRKRVHFVPSTSESSKSPPPGRTSAKAISDFYLQLVLSKESPPAEETTASSISPSSSGAPSSTSAPPIAEPSPRSDHQVCSICNLPLAPLPTTSSTRTSSPEKPSPTPSVIADSALPIPPKPRPHEASIAHQVCLTHSHPPSHLDRQRKGLSYLSSYGWDPDSRAGLGATGQGIQFPIKAKPKDDKLGLGMVIHTGGIRKKEKVVSLDAGKVRRLHEMDRRRADRLREEFYGSVEVDRYLGTGKRL